MPRYAGRASAGGLMHNAARGAYTLLGMIIAFVVVGCSLTIPIAVGAAGEQGTTVAAVEDAELVRLAERAKAAFSRRMEPPAIELPIAQIAARDRTAIVRDYTRDSYEAAVDALLAEARTPEGSRRVRAALRQLVDTGNADLAEAIFKEILERKVAEGDDVKRDAAAAARHSVALVQLPAAMAPLIKLPGEALPFPPHGQKAAPAYVRAAELDPDDPWTWMVLAILADTPEAFDRVIRNARKTAEKAGDPRAMIVHCTSLALRS